MSIVADVTQVKEVYKEAGENGWVLPCICTENLSTTEAILSAASEFGKQKGIKNVPIIIAITNNYHGRSQTLNYTHTKDWKTGLNLFTNDIKTLAGKGCYFENVRVMMHLDHIQFDADEELINSDLSDYASIMYDASVLPFEKNIELTAKFVEKRQKDIFIEGACDEIVDATGQQRNDLTTPENAVRYINDTGVSMIVANLGTEHRATGKELTYHSDVARSIKEKIGPNIVLHGTSSVTNEQVRNLYKDGICKVNIWTALERDSSPVLFEKMITSACKTAGPKMVEKLISEGYLTNKCFTGENISISNFTTVYRQNIIFNEMKNIVAAYLDMWYI